MPIEGLPDPEKHCLCIRCGTWHHPDEGSEMNVGPTSGRLPGMNIVAAFVSFPTRATSMRFVCYACRRKRLRIRLVVFGSLALLLLLAILAKSLGFL